MSKKQRPGPVEADWYTHLGIERTATIDEIRAAYLERAKKFHPDLNPKDHVAEENFKAISEAYSVLSDPGLRRRYHIKLGHIPGDGPADFQFDWHGATPASASRLRVVIYCVLSAIILGTSIYGAFLWLDKPSNTRIALRSEKERSLQKADRNLSDNGKPAGETRFEEQTSKGALTQKSAVKLAVAKELPSHEILSGETQRVRADPGSVSKVEAEKSNQPQDGFSGTITIRLPKRQTHVNVPKDGMEAPVIDDVRSKSSERFLEGDGRDYDSVFVAKFVAAENEERAPAADGHDAGNVNPSLADAESAVVRSPTPAEPPPTTVAEGPPPLPRRKPRQAAGEPDGSAETFTTKPRRFAYAPDRDFNANSYENYHRPLDWPPVWRPGRWYRMGRQLCKITRGGKLKCRKWRRIRDTLRRRRIHRARRTFARPLYWVRGQWYYYRGRLCKVKLGGEFVCLPPR